MHSPIRRGFFYSHVGWVFARANSATRFRLVPDLAKFPELRILDRIDVLVPILLGTACFGLGVLLQTYAPGLGTSGLANADLGFLRLDRASRPFDVHDQLVVASVRKTPLRDGRRQPQ